MKKFNTLFLSTIFIMAWMISLHAEDRDERYIGFKSSTLYLDKTFSSHSSTENIGIYDRYDKFSLVGIQLQRFLYDSNISSMFGGFEISMMFNDKNFLDDALFDLDGKIGWDIDNLKIYGIMGEDLHFFGDYTSIGIHFGIGATYDIQDNLGVTANYKYYFMTTNQVNNLNEKLSYELSGFSLGILYKYNL